MYNPALLVGKCESHEGYMRADIHAMTRELHPFDCIALLDGWERSEGACLEVAVARAIGLDVFELGGL